MNSGAVQQDERSHQSAGVIAFGLLLCGGGLQFLAAVPLDIAAQAWLVVSCLAGMLIMRRLPRRGASRTLFLTLAGFIVLRYFNWRVLHSLEYAGPLDFVAAIALFGAESYGIAIYFLGAFVNSRPIRRAAPSLPLDGRLLPTVDVLIPSFDEPKDILSTTLTAALALDYPSDRFQVCLLDDGGTEAKRQSEDADVRSRAVERHLELQALCRELGVRYLTRADNRNAKCGNLNAALSQTSGELLLVLDADHVPATDFLKFTVGAFIEDPRLFLVQTPHFFINPDPIERNLGTYNLMPSENAMFYDVVQPGLDFWGASIFCGSAALLRRAALEDCGGFRGESITEDAETALHLHGLGWRSVYLPVPLVAGLQPPTFTAFLIQRMRWAQGMVQIFRLHNPLFFPGLTLQQRLCYLSNFLFWFFPLARMIFLLAPVLFLVFGLQVYSANPVELLVYTLPYMMVLVIANHYLYGRVRWFLVSEVYETMLAYFSLPAVVKAFFRPKSPRFTVTPKVERLDDDFISPLASPFYLFIAIAGLAVVAGCVRFWLFPDKQLIIAFTLLWALINLAILIAALGALLEGRQRRGNPRLDFDIAAEIVVDGVTYPAVVKDLSVGGAQIHGDTSPPLAVGVEAELQVRDRSETSSRRFRVTVCNIQKAANGWRIGCRFMPRDHQEFRRMVLMMHGDSRRWSLLQQRRDRDPGIFASLLFLTGAGLRHGWRHLKRLLSLRSGQRPVVARA